MIDGLVEVYFNFPADEDVNVELTYCGYLKRLMIQISFRCHDNRFQLSKQLKISCKKKKNF